MVQAHGIPLKKKFGQHFLRQQSVADHMVQAVTLTPQSSVLEIGCGDGFLTKTIMRTPIARLWVFEIDPEWATLVRDTVVDARLTVFNEDILVTDVTALESHKPWTILANLPYQITFPILHLLQRNVHMIKEGVVMVQEEVAQKLLKTGGRGYGHSSLFFQYYFDWKKLELVPPSAFVPPPRIHSRLLYFKPAVERPVIPDPEQFWLFIKACFKQPRRMLRNNLSGGLYDVQRIPDATLQLRAQQMSFDDLLKLWHLVRPAQ